MRERGASAARGREGGGGASQEEQATTCTLELAHAFYIFQFSQTADACALLVVRCRLQVPLLTTLTYSSHCHQQAEVLFCVRLPSCL